MWLRKYILFWNKDMQIFCTARVLPFLCIKKFRIAATPYMHHPHCHRSTERTARLVRRRSVCHHFLKGRDFYAPTRDLDIIISTVHKIILSMHYEKSFIITCWMNIFVCIHKAIFAIPIMSSLIETSIVKCLYRINKSSKYYYKKIWVHLNLSIETYMHVSMII